MKKEWTTKDGTVLEISEMDTEHIYNCIRLLKKSMPDHEEDEVVFADLPESMWYVPSCYIEVGAKAYREKIAQFDEELSNRI